MKDGIIGWGRSAMPDVGTMLLAQGLEIEQNVTLRDHRFQ